MKKIKKIGLVKFSLLALLLSALATSVIAASFNNPLGGAGSNPGGGQQQQSKGMFGEPWAEYQTWDAAAPVPGLNQIPICPGSLSGNYATHRNVLVFDADQCGRIEKSLVGGSKLVHVLEQEEAKDGKQVGDFANFKRVPPKNLEDINKVTAKQRGYSDRTIDNWASLDSILMPKENSGGASGSKIYENKSVQVDSEHGGQVSYYNPVFRSQEELLSSGYCNMVQTGDGSGRFEITELPEPKAYCRTCQKGGQCQERECEEGEEPLFYKKFDVVQSSQSQQGQQLGANNAKNLYVNLINVRGMGVINEIETSTAYSNVFAPRYKQLADEYKVAMQGFNPGFGGGGSPTPGQGGAVSFIGDSFTILSSLHLYEPRQREEWKERISGIVSDTVDGNLPTEQDTERLSTTNICGRDAQYYLNDAKTWENYRGSLYSAWEILQSFGLEGPIPGDFEYYKIPQTGAKVGEGGEASGMASEQGDGESGDLTNQYALLGAMASGPGGQSEKGLILADDKRWSRYQSHATTLYGVCYPLCEVLKEYYILPPQIECSQLCSDISQYNACRKNILPTEPMVNRVQLGYTDKVKPAGAGGGNVAGNDNGGEFAVASNDGGFGGIATIGIMGNLGGQLGGIKNIVGSAKSLAPKWLADQLGLGDFAKGMMTNPTDWFNSEPKDKFGLNGPWSRDWVTQDAMPGYMDKGQGPGGGQGGTCPLGSRDKCIPSNYTLQSSPGANTGSPYTRDEGTPTQAFGMMGKDVDWDSIKDRQATCMRELGLQCDCTDEALGAKTPMGYIKQRVSGFLSHNMDRQSIMDEGGEFRAIDIDSGVSNKLNTETGQQINKIFYGVDLSGVTSIPMNWPAATGGMVYSTPRLGMPTAEGTPWPGKGKWLKTGLKEAKKGNIVFWDHLDEDGEPVKTKSFKAIKGEARRDEFIAFVEEVIPQPNGAMCYKVSQIAQFGNRIGGGIRAGGLGMPITRELCTGDIGKPQYSIDGKNEYMNCHYQQFKKCKEVDADLIKVIDVAELPDRDPKTGQIASDDGDDEPWKLAAFGASFMGGGGGGSGGSCDGARDKVNKALEKLRAKPNRGGLEDKKLHDPNKPEPEVEELQTSISELKKKGCNPDPEWSVKQFVPGVMQSVTTELAPSSMGGNKIADSKTYTNRTTAGFVDGFKLPIANPGASLPKFDFPYADQGQEGPMNCGEGAIKFIEDLKNLTGENRAKYKDDCAGVATNGTPRSSPNKHSTVCDGKEYGKFGLIYAAFNNKYTIANVNDLWFKTPSQAASSTSVIAYNNPDDGTRSEGQCKLSNLQSCGKKGDIVMVQTKAEATSSDPYDRWLIFNGQSFVDINEQQVTNPIRQGGLNASYVNMPHEVRRLACNR